MMRRLAPLFGLLLALPVAAHAQTGPNWQTGRIPSAAEWQAVFTGKVDVDSGTLNTPTLNGGTFNGNIGGSPTLAGVWTFLPGTVMSGVIFNNATFTGTIVFPSSVFGTLPQDTLTITPGAASTNPVTLSNSGTGGTQFNAPITVSWSPTNVASGTCSYFCSTGFPAGTLTGSQVGYASRLTINDKVTGAAGTEFYGLGVGLNVAPNGNSAVGPRVALDVNLSQIGTLQGGTITSSGITTALRGTMWMFSNLGGTSATSSGSGNAANVVCTIYSSSSYTRGCSGFEIDIGTNEATFTASIGPASTTMTVTAVTNGVLLVGNSVNGVGVTPGTIISALGSGTGGTGTYTLNNSHTVGSEAMTSQASYDLSTGMLLVDQTGAPDTGRLGPIQGIVISKNATAPGFASGIQFGDQRSYWGMHPYSKLLYAAPFRPSTAALQTAASLVDTSNVIASAYAIKTPYSVSLPLQATNITGVTRLTTDGAAASSYVYDAAITNNGTGYTSVPTASVTGCTAADIQAQLGSGAVIGMLQVRFPGSACAAEATVGLSGGGGASAAGRLFIAGNTLNFPINSALLADCKLTATSLTHAGTDAVGWHITFMAKMGATASTAAIVGSPAWVLDYETAGAAAKFSGSAPAVPTADTTFGAVNMSITPTSATWDVGGACQITRTSQI